MTQPIEIDLDIDLALAARAADPAARASITGWQLEVIPLEAPLQPGEEYALLCFGSPRIREQEFQMAAAQAPQHGVKLHVLDIKGPFELKCRVIGKPQVARATAPEEPAEEPEKPKQPAAKKKG